MLLRSGAVDFSYSFPIFMFVFTPAIVCSLNLTLCEQFSSYCTRNLKFRHSYGILFDMPG